MSSSPDSTPNRRVRLGVLISGIEDQYHTGILRGMMDTAREQDANLIVFAGGELASPVKDRASANLIYNLAVDAALDALILVTGTVLTFVNADQQIEFTRRYRVPKVSIGVKLPNAHNLLLSNGTGIQALIRHLVEKHGYRRIAFIQGPEGNEEATLRYQAYLESLKEYSIPFDRQLVVPGTFQLEDGAEAVRILLDQRDVTPDVIFGANDNMALGALYELQARSIAVPQQIAVVGFDDIANSVAVIPSLTTIRQPLYDQGKYGVELALAVLRGETVADPMVLDPELVVRQSCGCLASLDVDAGPPASFPDDIPLNWLLAEAKTATISNMLAVLPNARAFQWIDSLYDAFVDDLLDPLEPQQTPRFVSTLNTITERLLHEEAPIDLWRQILTVMRQGLVPLLQADRQRATAAENLWQQGQIFISLAIQHAEAHRQLQTRLQSRALNAIGEPLLTPDNLVEYSHLIADGFLVLGIRSGSIVIYEGESRGRLVMHHDRSVPLPYVSIVSAGNALRLPVQAVLSEPFAPENHCHTLLVEGLYFADMQFGFLVLEIEQAHADIYEAMRKQISSSIHTAAIMYLVREKHAQLETAMKEVKTTQSMLIHSEKMNALGQMVAGVAHEINNPIAFVNSNVHSLSGTFEDLVAAYDSLESYARSALPADNEAGLAQIRKNADLDYLVEDTGDLIQQTLGGLKRVKDIVTELRKFSRLDEAEFKLTNLRENIESTILVASGELRNRVTVNVDIDPALAFVCAAAELNQVFLNIIMNGAQAIDGKGTITISASEREHDVVIRFSDTGSGIPDDVIGRIFDPFFTTKPIGVGTGLGLAITHKIVVESHKGSINVETKAGEGTTFILTLPRETRR